MADAFACDLCNGLQHGKPVQTVTVKPILATATTALLLCDDCNASFNDWREARESLKEHA